MCLPACLWAQIARNPITELGRFLQNVMTINFRNWFISFQHKEKNYRIANMFITTRASVSPPRNVERRESGSMFCEIIETISWSSNESSRKHENIALKSTIPNNEIRLSRSKTNSILLVSLFVPHICGPMFEGFSLENIVKIQLPRQT